MIMCNQGYRPASTSLFGSCKNGKISGDYKCVRGSCDKKIYKEACWSKNSGRKRREGDEEQDFIEITDGMTIEDIVERKHAHKEIYVQKPELEYMLVCTLYCMDKHNIYGYQGRDDDIVSHSDLW